MGNAVPVLIKKTFVYTQKKNGLETKIIEIN